MWDKPPFSHGRNLTVSNFRHFGSVKYHYKNFSSMQVIKRFTLQSKVWFVFLCNYLFEKNRDASRGYSLWRTQYVMLIIFSDVALTSWLKFFFFVIHLQLRSKVYIQIIANTTMLRIRRPSFFQFNSKKVMPEQQINENRSTDLAVRLSYS